jgi:hypothetical protein
LDEEKGEQEEKGKPKVEDDDIEQEVRFSCLKGKLKKYLKSLPRKLGFKYVRFTEWYKGGGFGWDEFTPLDTESYDQNLQELIEDMKSPKGLVESFTIEFTDYWTADVVYPVTLQDIEFVQAQLIKLIKLK